MRILYVIAIFCSLLIYGCNNLEDVSPANRQSFTRFFGGMSDYIGKVAEVDQNGFIIGADSIGDSRSSAVIIKTDNFGNILWRRVLPEATVNAIKIVSDGYLIFGGRIQFIDSVQQVDKVKSEALLIKMDANGQVLTEKIWGSNSIDTRVDFLGNALTSRNDTIISIINFKRPGTNQVTIVAAHHPSTLDTLWTRNYFLIDRDIVNGKAVGITSSQNIIWASSAVLETQASKASYLSVPVIKPNSTFTNADVFGQNDDAYYSGSDLKASSTGFGVIGTRSDKTGVNSNVYFVKLNFSGSVIEGSELFFDASLSRDNASFKTNIQGETQDTGDALAVTTDGGYLLAGSMTTTATASGDIGNGGTDIYLIRLDAFGTVLWTRIIGGSGNESVSSVRQASDGGFIICGSNDLNELSSIMLLKTDENGELKK